MPTPRRRSRNPSRDQKKAYRQKFESRQLGVYHYQVHSTTVTLRTGAIITHLPIQKFGATQAIVLNTGKKFVVEGPTIREPRQGELP
ncbi:MAG TPA: hypothetical protein HA254_07225 [Candidatus Diapherotrites archaeon]|uniref:Uncharacterized protein n=1 Tax=Candidatus Iainarchaeum sp. TaxID=3101447 RepID=A0A7J4J2W7_9ARCH|nr:hypothetical protein [Candidatus Diapherotrites archaeon]